jgi:two-component system, OmpR family, sensor histidine kinase VicK
LTVELIDDTKQTTEDAMGLATYSNVDSTAFAYISIFENLWMQTEV